MLGVGVGLACASHPSLWRATNASMLDCGWMHAMPTGDGCIIWLGGVGNDATQSAQGGAAWCLAHSIPCNKRMEGYTTAAKLRLLCAEQEQVQMHGGGGDLVSRPAG